MMRRRTLRARSLLFALVLAPLPGCDRSMDLVMPSGPDDLEVVKAPDLSPVKDPISVMTRNLYHGGDIGPVLQAGFEDPFALMAAANQVWAEVLSNDFHERVQSVVDDIGAAMPDLVALQEAVEFLHIDTVGMTSIDFVEILEGELAARGLPYTTVAIQTNTVVPVPLAGYVQDTAFIPTEIVQLTDRLAALVRDDFGPLTISQGSYDETIPLYGPYSLKRGWIRVDVDVDGVPHHFINTHMEIQAFAATQAEQLDQLLNEVADGLDGMTVLLGDFNSNAEGGPGDPAWTPGYESVVAAGYHDAWEEAHPGRNTEGLTCCQASDLRNAESQFYQRIDFIFYRLGGAHASTGHFPGVLTVDLVGEEQSDRTEPNGLWPSDHAGLVAEFFWAPGQMRKYR